MIKTLCLLRHAQSADKQPGQPDKERELTRAGTKDAGKIGRALKKLNINFDLVISSTASRAKLTTLPVAEALRVDIHSIQWKEDIYEASANELFELVAGLDDAINTVLLVGHNPSISATAAFFSRTKMGDLPPGGLVTIRFTVSNWWKIKEDHGEFMGLLDPSRLES